MIRAGLIVALLALAATPALAVEKRCPGDARNYAGQVEVSLVTDAKGVARRGEVAWTLGGDDFQSPQVTLRYELASPSASTIGAFKGISVAIFMDAKAPMSARTAQVILQLDDAAFSRGWETYAAARGGKERADPKTAGFFSILPFEATPELTSALAKARMLAAAVVGDDGKQILSRQFALAPRADVQQLADQAYLLAREAGTYPNNRCAKITPPSS